MPNDLEVMACDEELSEDDSQHKLKLLSNGQPSALTTVNAPHEAGRHFAGVVFGVLGLLSRFMYLNWPNEVVFDELHFGKFVSGYIKVRCSSVCLPRASSHLPHFLPCTRCGRPPPPVMSAPVIGDLLL